MMRSFALLVRSQGYHNFKTPNKDDVGKDFPDGPVVKNPPVSAGDTGLIPGPGRSHMPLGN